MAVSLNSFVYLVLLLLFMSYDFHLISICTCNIKTQLPSHELGFLIIYRTILTLLVKKRLLIIPQSQPY